jgi:hypothetical protein
MSNYENVKVNSEIAPYLNTETFNNYYTYSFIDRSAFYGMISAPYYSFMNRIVKSWLWWNDGFVPYFHNSTQGIPSTHIAGAIVKKLARKVVGGRVMYKNTGYENTHSHNKPTLNEALNFISTKWAKKVDFEDIIKKATEYAAAAGTSLVKLNKDAEGELWCEALRFDSFIPCVDVRGKVTDIKCFLRYFTDLGVGEKREPQEAEVFTGFYVVEHRYFGDHTRIDGTELKNVPLVEYAIHRQSGSITNGNYISKDMATEIPFRDMPTYMRKAIGKAYPGIAFNRPIVLPFKDSLGCEIVKWTSGVGGLPELPFGESVLSNIITHLQAWDYYYAASNTDMYLGRGRVLAPKQITGAGTKGGNYNTGLDKFIYTEYQTTDPEGQKPTPIQFDLRSMDWTEIRNRLIQDMAINIGVNISTLASFLNDSTARTAREISTEENDTAEYVNDQRSTLEKPLNRILKLVTLYNGLEDDVVIRWSGAGLTNRHSLAEILSIALNSSTPFISQKKAVETFNYDDDDMQVWEEYEQIKADEKAKEQQYNDSNYFGDVNDSEQTIESTGIDDRGSGDVNKIENERDVFITDSEEID